MNSFCPAPWTSIFYNKNGSRICCTNGEFVPGSPADYRNSSMLREIKQEFLDGKRPQSCHNCWEFEDAGLESIRTQVYNKITPLSPEGLTVDTEVDLQYIEIRASNLCNFSCRMCSPIDSNQIAMELEEKPHLKQWLLVDENQQTALEEITEEDFNQIKKSLPNAKWIMLTGGEPMIIKQYYDLLDYMNTNNISQNVTLQFHTNASVYNKKTVEKLQGFKSLYITLSLDGANQVAEYQRYGTDWSTVEKNCFELAKLKNCYLSVNSALSAYTILDLENFTKFLLTLYNANTNTWFNMKLVQYPKPMKIYVLNNELRERAIQQIELSEQLIKDIPNFSFLTDGFKIWKEELRKPYNHEEYNDFVMFTKDFDESRNENFESIFNYKLY